MNHAPAPVGMGNRRRFKRIIRQKLRSAGKQYEEAKRAYETGKETGRFDLPRDEDGNARIVCRRHAEKRAVDVDDRARPECFDAEHPDCRGCVEDIRDGIVETW